MEKEIQSSKQPWSEPKITEIEIKTTEWWTHHRRRPPRPHCSKTKIGCGDFIWDDPS